MDKPYKPLFHPRLAIPLGDLAGIGSEVVLKALANPQIRQNDITLIGSRALLEKTYSRLLAVGTENPLPHPDDLSLLDVELDPELEQQILLGGGNAASGAASFQFLEQAIAQTLAGNFHAIVTAPIAKSAWKAAGHDYPGQTELLAERAGVKRFGMLFVARSPHTGWTLRTLLATTHIPLKQVSEILSVDLMTQKLELLLNCLQQDFGLEAPRIAIAGLNPHSGEQGQLGREEQDWLIPWLNEMRDRFPSIDLEGPIPPDTLWVKPGQAWFGPGTPTREKAEEGRQHTTHTTQNVADAYLALYHDQGLIPVKLMAFDRAVNTTIGLPFVRTSPDHGTAFDIAGQGIADATSMKAAIELAVELSDRRHQLLT
ncbi:4-hydroxythreonine-4-phosphate dehydrogenase PdxA [Phormidium sp. CLA17]|uniref:4-hydroxythreonine-4-phosphate dehydrogenase PdxA n=1 Tax=Leptolyngbya sp. Cla-17 TaxID=2803751 RepID=UPI0014922F45|nr:4-hydroxythreonine-4-phosphate dehydrogenase PdxA [Leptolyngbya sp. Cla-17]MBM0742652.1 4-hydroxythreonine-4-phosphate dehydrogenase PdxA [Leptolyngbya sp. Cla-17]